MCSRDSSVPGQPQGTPDEDTGSGCNTCPWAPASKQGWTSAVHKSHLRVTCKSQRQRSPSLHFSTSQVSLLLSSFVHSPKRTSWVGLCRTSSCFSKQCGLQADSERKPITWKLLWSLVPIKEPHRACALHAAHVSTLGSGILVCEQEMSV